jgi:hypothetical protein
METYRGFQYDLVAVTDPAGWRWTVFFSEGRSKTGGGISHAAAMRNIKRTIDKAAANTELTKK